MDAWSIVKLARLRAEREARDRAERAEILERLRRIDARLGWRENDLMPKRPRATRPPDEPIADTRS